MNHLSLVHGPTELEEMSKPSSAAGLENIEMDLYDTVLFTSASTTELTFFTHTDVNRGFLTNMQQAGQIPSGHFFMPYTVTLTPIGWPPADQARAADLYNLLFGYTAASGVPYAYYSYGTKRYPQAGGWPLYELTEAGGITFFTTRTATEGANNFRPGGGLSLGQDADGNSIVVIKGAQPFSWQLQWPAAVTLTGGNPYLRVSMHGTYYRPIQ